MWLKQKCLLYLSQWQQYLAVFLAVFCTKIHFFLCLFSLSHMFSVLLSRLPGFYYRALQDSHQTNRSTFKATQVQNNYFSSCAYSNITFSQDRDKTNIFHGFALIVFPFVWKKQEAEPAASSHNDKCEGLQYGSVPELITLSVSATAHNQRV